MQHSFCEPDWTTKTNRYCYWRTENQEVNTPLKYFSFPLVDMFYCNGTKLNTFRKNPTDVIKLEYEIP